MPSATASQSALLALPGPRRHNRPSPSRALSRESREQREEPRDGQDAAEPPSEFSRVIGYHNSMAPDESMAAPSPTPPSYHEALLAAKLQPARLTTVLPKTDEKIPAYSCSVAMEGVLSMKLEKSNPFDEVANPQWSEVFCSLQGTLLRIHQAKSGNIFGKAAKPDKRAGRLIKSYTLQHAEVGIAADHKKIELVPRVHFATLLPQATLQMLQMSEPQMFMPVRQYVIRLRLENDQLLLRFDSSESRAEWVDKLCQGVDISPPLEARTEPKYHTLPRRRRRRHGERSRIAMAITSDPAVVEEQERMIREFFPQLQSLPAEGDSHAQQISAADVDLNEVEGGPSVATGAPDPDTEDLDRDFVVEGDAAGQATSQPHYELNEPRTRAAESRIPKRTTRATMDPAMAARYRRRCMPSLLFNSRRADDIIISNGKRWRIDWDVRELKPFIEPPPEYPSDDNSDRSSSSEESPATRTLRQFLKLTPSANPGLADASPQQDALLGAGAKSDRPSRPPTTRTNSGKDPQTLTQRFKRITGRKNMPEAESASVHIGS